MQICASIFHSYSCATQPVQMQVVLKFPNEQCSQDKLYSSFSLFHDGRGHGYTGMKAFGDSLQKNGKELALAQGVCSDENNCSFIQLVRSTCEELPFL